MRPSVRTGRSAQRLSRRLNKRLLRQFAAAGAVAIAALTAAAWEAIALRWSPPWGQPDTCRVERVLDGDSLWLHCAGERVEVRLHCIDAPEKDQRPWSDAARASLRRLTRGPLELVPVERDGYGRTVGKLYARVDGERRFVNLEQVRSGAAAVYRRYCRDHRFDQAEDAARAAQRGIWSRPGEQQTPWLYRRHHRR